MIKHIIHIADIHLRTYKRQDEYRAGFKTFFANVTSLFEHFAYEEKRIAIVGDIVHQKITISNEQTDFLTWLFKELVKIAPVVIIAGNHDLLEDNKDRMDSLTPIINLINDSNITYLKESKCVIDDNITWAPYSIFNNNKRPNIEEARKESPTNKIVGLFHAPVLYAKTDLGFVFSDHGVKMSHFKGCDMVLLGDIHKQQDFNITEFKEIHEVDLPKYEKDGWLLTKELDVDAMVKIRRDIGLAAYCGSLFQQNFGETINGHGFLTWDVDDGTYTHHEVESEYKFYQFKITSVADIENNKEVLTNE